jgi:hypothetical protein
MEVFGSPVVAYVSCDRGCWNRLRRARLRESVLTVEVVGSSVVAIVSPGFVVAVIGFEGRENERRYCLWEC